MESVVELLNRHGGRDRVIRTSSYLSFLLTAIANQDNKERLCELGSQLSSCRTVLRLFDDVVMLNYNLKYGLGKKEEDRVTRHLSVVCNVVDQLFYPVEHLAWAADKILHLDSTGWWYLSTILWATSLYLNLLKCMRTLFILRKKRGAALLKMDQTKRDVELEELQTFISSQCLSVVEHMADLCNAIHWMPQPFLWSGKLKLWQVGFFGLLSSIIGLYKMYKFT